jgi:hypothetical protein
MYSAVPRRALRRQTIGASDDVTLPLVHARPAQFRARVAFQRASTSTRRCRSFGRRSGGCIAFHRTRSRSATARDRHNGR